MSSFWAGYSGTALVLNENEFNEMIDQYGSLALLFAEDDEEKEEIRCLMGGKDSDHGDEVDFCLREYGFTYTPDLGLKRSNRRTFEVTPVLSDDCSGMRFIPFKNEKMSWIEGEKDCYVFFADKDSYIPYGKKAYKDYDELVDEFKLKLSGYLPRNFDWDMHIGYFSYAAYA